MSNKINFAKLVVREGAVGFLAEPKLLASEKLSSYYINCRRLLERLFVRDQVVSYVIEEMIKNGINENNFDTVSGVTEGAIKLGDAVSEALIRKGLKTSDQLFQMRLLPNERKTGVDKDWVGGKKPDLSVVVEDAVTTGRKAWEFICRLRDSGVEINDVFGLVDRLQLENRITAKERFLKEGINLHTITTSNEVLQEYLRVLLQEDSEIVARFVEVINEEYRREYEEADRESPIKLEI
jgi:orotate phosphoribosyltransferase